MSTPRRLVKTVKRWLEVDGSFLAAAVTFYAAIALFPLMLILLSIFGVLMSRSSSVQDWKERLMEMIADQTSQDFADTINSQLENIQAGSSISGSIGLLTLLAFSVALFANLERAFGIIWQSPKEKFSLLSNLKRVLFHRLKAFLMILLIVLVISTNFVIHIYLESMSKYLPDRLESGLTWWAVQMAAELAINALLFTFVFQIVPKEKVRWRHAMHGGVLTAILWEPGRYLIATLLISDNYTAFGVVGAFLAVLLWIYYGVTVMLFGATVVSVVSNENQLPTANN